MLLRRQGGVAPAALLQGFLGGGRQRKWQDGHALLQQLHRFFGGGLAADAAFGRLSMVDAAGLLCESSTHVLRVACNVPRQAQPRGLQGLGQRGSLALMRWSDRRRRSALRGSSSSAAPASIKVHGLIRIMPGARQRGRARSEVQPGRAQALVDLMVIAKGTLHQLALLLRLEIVFGRKPPLKDVALAALEIENLHGGR